MHNAPQHLTALRALAIVGGVAAWITLWTLALVAIADRVSKSERRR